MACDEEGSQTESAEAVESAGESGDEEAAGRDGDDATTGESGDAESGGQPGAAAEPTGKPESGREVAYREHLGDIARAVCPDGELVGELERADYGCGRCPELASRGELEDDERAGLTIHVGRFTPEALGSGRLEALVDVGDCAPRIDGYSHAAFLVYRDGYWEVRRHSADLDLDQCNRVRVGSPARTSLQCMTGGLTHQGITSATVVSLLFDSDGWRKQRLAEMKSNGGSGMGDECVTVRPTLRSVDDEEPVEAEIAMRIRGRVRPRTDDRSCGRLGDDEWDDDTTIRYRWNGERFEVPDQQDRAVLERNVARTEVGDFEFAGYPEPERVDNGWTELNGGDAELEAVRDYEPSDVPESMALDRSNILDEGLEWTDETGENLLVFVRRDRKDPESNERSATLLVFHVRKLEDGRWKTVRDFRQPVRDCGLDLVLSPEVGRWSLTDLDEDGVDEVSFAWSNGCVGGMDPATHKVLVTEDGDKSILRGRRRMRMPMKGKPGHTIGGEIREAEGFDGDDRRREHAEKVWEATVE